MAYSYSRSTKCKKIKPKEHLQVYDENKEMDREIKRVDCDNNTLQRFTTNYLIVRKIVSNLNWQDRMMCREVSDIWCDAVYACQRDQLKPRDFVIELKGSEKAILRKSGPLVSEPIAVLTFVNPAGFIKTANCKHLHPCRCTPSCVDEHNILDFIHQELAYPKRVMVCVRANNLSYIPEVDTLTARLTVKKSSLSHATPFIGGFYFPTIPDVEHFTINIRSDCDMKEVFYDVVDKVSETRVFKAIMVFVTDKYLLQSLDEIKFLNYFKELQPTIPFALGGCIIEDTLVTHDDYNSLVTNINEDRDYISENIITISIFTTPKELEKEASNKCNFDAFCLVIESMEWNRPRVENAIRDFADKVPRFEHSVAFKLSCVGRESKHDLEQDLFRSEFPGTPLLGCYCNGELGINKPERPMIVVPKNAKRHWRDSSPQFGIMYSYSTVFMYIGWGKIIAPPRSPPAQH